MSHDVHDLVFTDFGVVRLSKRTTDWLGGFDPEWRQIQFSKKRRGKKAERVRAKVKQLESAVCLAAEMAFVRGELLEEF